MGETYTRPEFVEKYGGFISYAVRGTGIHEGTLVAQAVLESQGKVGNVYKVGGSKLSREANNFFGIKCHNWSGKGYNIDTGEQMPDGTKYTEKSSCFRAYNSVEDSIADYVKFLKENPRYEKAGVFDAPDVASQAQALKDAGYATAANYAGTVTGIYDSLKDYIDKYSTYGIKGIAKSFAHDPIAFVKRNKWAVGITAVALVGIGVGIYFLVRKK